MIEDNAFNDLVNLLEFNLNENDIVKINSNTFKW